MYDNNTSRNMIVDGNSQVVVDPKFKRLCLRVCYALSCSGVAYSGHPYRSFECFFVPRSILNVLQCQRR